MANHDPEAFETAAGAIGFQGFGFYPRSGLIHIDLGPARSWGERFPKRATAFAVETPPARKVLAERRALKVVATIGAAGVEVAQEVLAETQGAILPLVLHVDTSRWVFSLAWNTGCRRCGDRHLVFVAHMQGQRVYEQYLPTGRLDGHGIGFVGLLGTQ